MANPNAAKAQPHAMPSTESGHVWSWGILVAGGISLGTAPILVKGMPLPPESSAFFRVLLSAPFFLVLALWSSPQRPQKEDAAPAAACARSVSLSGFAAVFFSLRICFAIAHSPSRRSTRRFATLFTNCGAIVRRDFRIDGD